MAMTDNTSDPTTTHATTQNENDVPCIRCGYNLRGLTAVGRCPECGEATEISMRGRNLAAADQSWIRSLVFGAALAGASPIMLMGMIFIVPRVMNDSRVAIHLSFTAVFAIGGIGLWLVSRREPHGPYFDDPRWTRRTIRAISVAAAPLGMVYGVLRLFWRSDWTVLGLSVSSLQSWCLTISLPAALIAIMLLLPRYLAVLSRRLPSRRLSRHGHLAMLGLPGVVAVIAVAALLFTRSSFRPSFMVVYCVFLAFLFLPGLYSIIWA